MPEGDSFIEECRLSKKPSIKTVDITIVIFLKIYLFANSTRTRLSLIISDVAPLGTPCAQTDINALPRGYAKGKSWTEIGLVHMEHNFLT